MTTLNRIGVCFDRLGDPGQSVNHVNLNAVNVVLHGLLGLGVAASSRFDPQAKGLGEWARSRHVDIPEELL